MSASSYYGEGVYGAGLYGGADALPVGALALSSITIDGVPVPLGEVLADVTIRHGRAGFFDTASPATCQLTLLGVSSAFARSFRLGARLIVDAIDGTTIVPRFNGRFTDASLDGDTLTAIAVGRHRTLAGYTIGAGAWPAESWSARVTRAFAEAGLAAYLALEPAGVLNPPLLARAAEPVSLAAYLDELASMVQSAVADLPDGRILVQPILGRTLANTYALDPAEVRYAPAWSQRLPGANVVTVTYGEPEASVTGQDAASVAIYGPIAATIATTFANVADANAVRNNRLATDAYGHWTIQDAPLLRGRQLAIGQPLTLEDMPAGSPYDPWSPILEGWTDSILSDGEKLVWTMELALSDPQLSGLALPWNTVPASELWNTLPPDLEWRDALTLDSL